MPSPLDRTTPLRDALDRSLRRRVVVVLLLALGFVSGVGASSRIGDAAPGSEVVASFAAVPIESLPLHAEHSAPGEQSEALPSVAAPPPLGLGRMEVTKGELGRGESLGLALQRQGISPSVVHLVAQHVRPVFDFRRSQPGHRYRLALDSSGKVVDFRYSTSVEESVYVFWDGAGYAVRRERAELVPRVSAIAGIVETSLYEAVRDLGEDPQLASDFADVFAWDIDFSRNAHPGDEFSVLYERLYSTDDDGEEIYVRPGLILVARYNGRSGEHSAVYYGSEGRGGYFRPDGSSVERTFLVAPLKYGRISSSYTTARRHPILNVTRPHPGIDYAAAEGTQLWSVADGTVVFKGRAGASGNLVKVRHAKGYTSHYAHLSRFASGLHVGQRVHQKEVIGYVGQTGLATGSHVCFRVTRNGRYVNPLEIRSPSGEPVGAALARDFWSVRDSLLADLDSRTVAAADEAL